MRIHRKVSSKAEKNSNRAAQKRQKFYTYGRAMLFGYFEITKRFACGQDAMEWLRKVKSGWRSKIYDAHLYYDECGKKPMIKGHDAFKFAWFKKRFGLQEAIKLVQEGAF
ncbi:MAG: hypothetical protein IKJ08_07210 [Alistipes sp.]|nr:hypothetical protein [Alistipes sp.]